VLRHDDRPLADRGAQFLHVYKPRHWINCGQAGPLGWTIPAALGVRVADPTRRIIALSGDYDFQFMIEELAVGAQFKLPYIHVVVNNAYLGLIRQSQRGFDMDYCVQLSFDNVNAPGVNGYGVDHVAVAEGLGCKAIRVTRQEEIDPAIAQAEKWMAEHRVPVVVEIMLERVTNIAMGTEIDKSSSSRSSPGTSPTRRPPLPRCSTSAREQAQDRSLPSLRHHAKVRRQLTMLYNELDFLERFDAAAAAGFVPSNSCFRMLSPPRKSALDSSAIASSWCCTIFPGQLGRGRARHRLPSRPRR
jgi:TPP-dependent pyruvate/acetoin dehydrogenase alpha subunit